MAEQKSGIKKAVTKKTVKKAAAIKKTPVKKSSAVKKTAIKKAAVKKSVVTKSPSAPVVTDSSEKNANAALKTFHKETLSTIQAIVEEMSKEQTNRDQQITSMVQEIRQGFSTQTDLSQTQNSVRDKEMSKLYQSLQTAFHSVEENNNENEDRSLLILKSLKDSIMQDHEQTLKEVHEQEKLQDKKFKHLTKVEEHRAGRNRWIAIPGMIIAMIAIIYMFYVVTIMESAMTSMSRDMGKMQIAVGTMSQKVGGMSQDTHSMNSSMGLLNESVGKMSQDTHSMNNNMTQLSEDTSSMNGSMKQLNNNIGVMSQDLNIMTRNVAPTMKGMRDMMPWSP